MNVDILLGACLEIKGRVKEKWGKLTVDEYSEIEGKSEILLGRLRKQYGYIRGKAELEYRDSVALAIIVSDIRKMMKKKELMAISFIARYGNPLSAKNQESSMSAVEKKRGYNTDRNFGVAAHFPIRNGRVT